MKNVIDLILNKTSFTINELASRLNVSRQTIAEYRKDPDKITTGQLKRLSSISGISMDSFFDVEKFIPGPQIKTDYDFYSEKINAISAKVDKTIKSLSDMKIDENLDYCITERNAIIDRFNDIKDNARLFGRKPVICALGHSDVGKSTFLNYLIGEMVLPAGYSPKTTVPTYIMHASMRPAIFEDKADTAIVFGRSKNDSKDRFDHKKYLADKDGSYIKEYALRIGTFESILSEFGTRDGAYFENDTWLIDEILVFVDSDILKTFTLIDTPGFGTGEASDDIGLMMDSNDFDFVFYLSTADAFMRGSETSVLMQMIRTRVARNEFDTLYILATHSGSIGDPDKVNENVIIPGCKRLIKEMSNKEKEELKLSDSDNDISALLNRCMGFDHSMEFYCSQLNKKLEQEIPEKINKRMEKTYDDLKDACKAYCDEYKGLREKLREEERSTKSNEEKEERKKAAKEAIKRSQKELGTYLTELQASIDRREQYCINKIHDAYRRIMNEDYIVDAIEKKEYKNKKADIESLSNYLTNELNSAMSSEIGAQSKCFADEVQNMLSEYKHRLAQDPESKKLSFDFVGFDFERAFASGLAGLATYGALAIWATIVAGGSNLGAYILVAKVVSVLSAFGISVGGTAAAASFIASIGGPVTIGVALAVIIAIGVYGIFSGTWKNRVAKRLIKEYEKKCVEKKYIDEINSYWSDTRTALDKCMNSLEKGIEDFYEYRIYQEDLSDEMMIRVNTVLFMLYGLAADALEKCY